MNLVARAYFRRCLTDAMVEPRMLALHEEPRCATWCKDHTRVRGRPMTEFSTDVVTVQDLAQADRWGTRNISGRRASAIACLPQIALDRLS